MSNRPMPAHHRETFVSAALITDEHGGYGGVLRIRAMPQHLRLKWWIIVAAAPVDAANPPPAGMVRVIVAPAKVAP